MKRGFVFSLCAAAALASAQLASAQNTVTVSLDIYFNNGNDNTTGGTWQLLAKVTGGGAQGLAGLDTALTGTDGVGIFKAPTPAFKTTYDAKSWTQDQDGLATTLDMLFGQVPLAAGTAQDLQYGVGISPFNNPDELGGSVDVSGINMANAVTLAFGKFANGSTPAFASATASAANVFTAAGNATTPPAVNTIVAATVSQQVRTNAATRAGDATLDKAVTSGDITRVLGNFGSTGVKLWQEGDVTGDGNVTSGDVTRVLGNFGQAPVAGVPEPATGLLVLIGLAGISRLRKRS